MELKIENLKQTHNQELAETFNPKTISSAEVNESTKKLEVLKNELSTLSSIQNTQSQTPEIVIPTLHPIENQQQEGVFSDTS